MTEPERFYAVAPIEMVDVRDSSSNDDNTWTMSGYATVFNTEGVLFDNKFERLTVQIDRHAFDSVFANQDFNSPSGVVHFNHGHDVNTSVAATDIPAGRPGSLQLSVDQNGLRFLAKVPRDDPDGISLASKMRSGVVKQASFAFTAARDEFRFSDKGDDREHVERYISDIKQIYDVCATSRGVISQTVSQLETYAMLLGQPATGGHRRQPDMGGDNDVSRESGGAVDTKRSQSPLVLELQRFMAEEKKRLSFVFAERSEHGRDE